VALFFSVTEAIVNVVSAKRSQFRLASVLHMGIFGQKNIVIPENARTGLQVPNVLVEKDDIVATSVIVESNVYKINMLVVLEVSSQDKATVGWIKGIIIRNRTVLFVVTKSVCIRQPLGYFSSCETGKLKLSTTPWSHLKSFKPLIPRGTECSFVFCLRGKLPEESII
jgi:hypothetical protein